MTVMKPVTAHLHEHYLELARPELEQYQRRKPDWVTRDQGWGSLNYVMGVVKEYQPKTMLEIGVSAGFMSGAMLIASETYDPTARVYGIDVSDKVYYAPEKRVGALVDEAYPELRHRLELFLANTCVDVPALLSGPIDMVYVDSLHAHPWPVLDVLNALTRMDTGGVIAMDGVHFGAPGHDGSTYFFHHYTGDKQSFEGTQTGVVPIPDRGTILEHCLEVLELGWQIDVGEKTLAQTVDNVRAELGRAAAKRVAAICKDRHAHFQRFETTYTMAARTQWEYVESMKALALREAGVEPA